MHGKLGLSFNRHSFAFNIDLTLCRETFTELCEVFLARDGQSLCSRRYPCVESLGRFTIRKIKLAMEATSGERRSRTHYLGIHYTFVFPKSHHLFLCKLRFVCDTKVQLFLEEVPRCLLHLLFVLGVDYLEAA